MSESTEDPLDAIGQILVSKIRTVTSLADQLRYIAMMRQNTDTGTAVKDRELADLARTLLYEPQFDRWWNEASDDEIVTALGYARRFQDQVPEANQVLVKAQEHLPARMNAAEVVPAPVETVKGQLPILPGEELDSEQLAVLGEAGEAEHLWGLARTETDVAFAREDEIRNTLEEGEDPARLNVAENEADLAAGHEDVAYDSMERRTALLNDLSPKVGVEAAQARVTADTTFSRPPGVEPTQGRKLPTVRNRAQSRALGVKSARTIR